MVLVASDAYLGRRASLVGSLSGVEACYWHYVGASVIYALLSSAGLLLLVIPGVYVGTVLCLGGCAVVLEGGGVFGALRRSREIVRGSFWRVFIVLLALYAAMGLPQVAAVQWAGGPTPWVQCATHVWLAVLWPLWTAAHVVLYHELVAARGTSAPLEGDEARTREVGGCLLAVLVALGLVLAVAALAFSWSVLLDQVFG